MTDPALQFLAGVLAGATVMAFWFYLWLKERDL